MTKKSRNDEERRIPLSPAQMVQPGMKNIAEAAPSAAPGMKAPDTSEMREEYHYVLADLKRIGVIALVMLAVLIALVLLLP